MQNKFKIITPSFNNEKWVDTYYYSITNQTYQNFEVLYLDDCSTDDTLSIIKKLSQDNNKFHIITNKHNIKSTANTFTHIFDFMENDEEILVHVDGDDWLADINVLKKINDIYNENNCWMTYGGYIAWKGKDELIKPYPQNSDYEYLTHKYNLYRRDMWRGSHLHTYKWFVHKQVKPIDMKSLIDNKFYHHAADLQLSFSAMEMCPLNKIYNVPFITYIRNACPEAQIRTIERENSNNAKYEMEIRNRKKFKQVKNKKDLTGEKIPLINVFGGFRERHSIPSANLFSYIYNINDNYNEADVVIFSDANILKYLSGEILIKKNIPIIADICECPDIGQQKEVYTEVIKNYDKFNLILGWHEDILALPNAEFKSSTEISQWTKIPNELDETLFRIYSDKTQLCSMVCSTKTMTNHQKFRIQCAKSIKDKISLFGRGLNEIDNKLFALKDYMFSVAMENGVYNNYFTEKIIDCFLTGTIPIYYGAPNIDVFFDINGIIPFNTIEELINIINNLDIKLYNSKLSSIKNNLDIAKKIRIDNDRYFNRYIKSIVK